MSDIEAAKLHPSWCEVDVAQLSRNARFFKSLVGEARILAMAVKADAYGHGLVVASRALLNGGADWLCVHSIQEAEILRKAGIPAPIHLVGPVPVAALSKALKLDLSLIVYTHETVDALVELGMPARLHLKAETGNNRQGVDGPSCLELAQKIVTTDHLQLEGICTHFSDIEDTTDHRFAREQISRFEHIVSLLELNGISVPIRHVANTAATLLWSNLPYELVRVGIGAYGLWPSKETRIAALIAGQNAPSLGAALTWKCLIAQVKDVPEGEFIGYGRTFRTTHASRIAVLPVGYYDGYDRKASNRGFVLCDGKRAPVVGRVCMNMMMVDVTHIPDAAIGVEVVLLGNQGDDSITAEDVALWTGTINYEVMSRIGGHVPRVAVVHAAKELDQGAPYRLPTRNS